MSIPRPREADVLRACIAWLDLVAIPHRVNSGGFRVDDRFVRANNQPGCSDLLVLLPGGKWLSLEVKRPGGVLSRKQKTYLDRVTAMGGLAMVVRSLDDLRAQLAAEGYPLGGDHDPR